MATSLHTAVATPSVLGECPVWSTKEQALYWLDIEGRVVHRYDPTSGVSASRGVPGRPGSLFLTAEPGELIIALEHELVRMHWGQPGAFSSMGSLEAPATGNRCRSP